MPQLALFEGSHVPRTAAREALARGELGEARAHLASIGGASEESADAARLDRIAAAVCGASGHSVEAVHAGFASALAAREPRGFLSAGEWFRLYALRVAAALAAEPARALRGWLGAHFAWAAGDGCAAQRAAQRVVETAVAGQAWVEAARLAFASGEPGTAAGWLHAACLASPAELVSEAPALAACGVDALDASVAVPRLPIAIEDLFDEARGMGDLPAPRARWVAVLGEIDRVLAPLDRPGAEPRDPGRSDGDGAREFLTALRAARRSRERDGVRSPDRCSDRELRARKRMQRIAPALLERYLRGLGGVLV